MCERLNREVLYEILKRRGIPPKLRAAVQALYDDLQAKVRVNGMLIVENSPATDEKEALIVDNNVIESVKRLSI